MSILIVRLIADDFNYSEPILAALDRQSFPIVMSDLVSCRNGMEYQNMYGETWTLSAQGFMNLKAKFVKTYTLRYEGQSVMTLRQFMRMLDRNNQYNSQDWNEYLGEI